MLSLNIPTIRSYFQEALYDPINLAYNNKFKDVNALLSLPKISKYELTNRNYWLIYVLIQKLVDNGINVRQAAIKVADILYTTYGYAHRRYYEMRKKALKNKWNINDIIDKYGFRYEIYSLQRESKI